ncbi:unnamed protein product [Orchesella dallaii]|uniref:C2H2-type domain-containing protein n=1 Tax=Orchesella dallaii TaxID=48710 RepID=A0ABP1PJ10_9HEXA
MDTPICFLCLKTIKRDSFQLQQLVGESETYLFSPVFSKLAQEYLGLEEEVAVGLSEVFKNVSNFCEKCEFVIGSLCEMYLEHLGIQLRLRWKLSELGKLLESSKIGVSEKLESVIIHSLASQVDSSVMNVNRLRSLLLEKCIKKDMTSLPLADEIKVEVKSSCGGDDDPLFFLAHEVKMESFSNGEDLDENYESNENWIDKEDGKVQCESIQFHDETVMNEDEDDFDFVPPDRNKSSWEEDEKSKRKPVRKRKRAATPKQKCSKAGAQKRICTKKEMANNLQIEGWNCSICNEPTVDKASLRKHFVCHQNKASRLDFQCTFCWRSFESQVSVDNHLLNTHMTVACDGAYSCDAPGCTLTFSNLQDLNSHSETHLKPEKSLRICKTCGLGCLNLTVN